MPNIPYFSLSAPEWYQDAKNSGVIAEYTKDTSIVGYVPYQQARKASIIAWIAAGVFSALNLPEKGSFIFLAVALTAASAYLYKICESERVAIQRFQANMSKQS